MSDEENDENVGSSAVNVRLGKDASAHVAGIHPPTEHPAKQAGAESSTHMPALKENVAVGANKGLPGGLTVNGNIASTQTDGRLATADAKKQVISTAEERPSAKDGDAAGEEDTEEEEEFNIIISLENDEYLEDTVVSEYLASAAVVPDSHHDSDPEQTAAQRTIESTETVAAGKKNVNADHVAKDYESLKQKLIEAGGGIGMIEEICLANTGSKNSRFKPRCELAWEMLRAS